MNKIKILVTGADGVLGSNLLRELLSREYNVRVFLEKNKKTPTIDELPIEKYYGNILNKKQLTEAFNDIDIVYHCAASTSVYPPRNEIVNQINIQGTNNIIECCLEHEIKRLIYVGTANSFGFGDSKNNLGKENTHYKSAKYGLDYMDSKQKAQENILHAVKEKKLPAIIINPTFMIGPFDSKPSSGAMILALYHGKIPGYTNGGKNYIAVKDVAIAMVNAIEMGCIGECYIVGNQNLSYQEAFELFAKTLNCKIPKRRLSKFVTISYGTINSFFAKIFKFNPTVTKELALISTENHYYSSEKAQRELNLPQTPIEHAVKESFEWFKENGYIKK